ncbi:hypothetical protein ACJMK2_011989 [Sinanodonta woodiana]|uniref:Amidase domain-containing protein n=1 Tax=Sinanodonta woodiana TaxID=1069815 RepID=A0ABD3V9P1_SINWO
MLMQKINFNLYHVPAVRPPGLEQLRELSQSMGLQCTDDDLSVYQEYVTGTLHSYDRISRLVGPSLPVKYARTPGYRPSLEENTLNGWYWKCDIKGAGQGKLAGKTVGIKDSVAVAGVPMVNGSKLLEGYMPEFDATVVTRILDAGGNIVGKTNCEDLCCSGSSFTNVTGPTLNPHDRSRSSGGSSSGSAALVAAKEIDMAIGGDQGGSIRIPASWCGIVGLKPTFGLVPYTGACPIEITIDHLGPMAKTVYDCALLLEVIAGPDGDNDSRQPRNYQVPEYTKVLSTDMKGKKIAMITEGFTCCKQNVQDIVRNTALQLATKDAIVEEVSIPLHKDGVTIWAPIITEGGFNCIYKENGTGCHWKGFYPLSIQESLTRGFNLRPDDASDMFKAMMLFAAFIQKNYQNKFYSMAQNLNMMLTAAYNKVLEEYDVLLMPTIPFVAIDLPKMGCTLKDRLYSGIGMVANTAPFNSTGHPAISINAGTSPEGLPVGMMIVGRHFDETSVLQIAYAYEQLLNS